MRIEERLLDHLINSGYAAQGPHLYQYGEGHWTSYDTRSRQHIYHALHGWMSKNAAQHCGNSRGMSIIRSAMDQLSMLRPLPSSVPTGPVLIPFKNATIELHRDGRILVGAPNPRDGLTTVVPLALDASHVSDYIYTPLAARPGSAWGTFLRTFAPDQTLQDRFAEGFGAALTNRGWDRILYLHGPTGTGKTTITRIMAGFHKGGCVNLNLFRGERMLKPEIVGRYYDASLLQVYDRTLKNDRKGLMAWAARDVLSGRQKCERRSDFEVAPCATIVMDEDESRMAPQDPLLFTLPLTHSFLKVDRHNFEDVVLQDPVSRREVLDWLIAGASRVVQRGYL